MKKYTLNLPLIGSKNITIELEISYFCSHVDYFVRWVIHRCWMFDRIYFDYFVRWVTHRCWMFDQIYFEIGVSLSWIQFNSIVFLAFIFVL